MSVILLVHNNIYITQEEGDKNALKRKMYLIVEKIIHF